MYSILPHPFSATSYKSNKTFIFNMDSLVKHPVGKRGQRAICYGISTHSGPCFGGSIFYLRTSGSRVLMYSSGKFGSNYDLQANAEVYYRI